MPFYDYVCQRCGHVVEVMRGVHDAGPSRCVRCGGEMRKLMSRPTIVFKGSGWAGNDARAARTAGAAKSATDSDADHRPAAAAGAEKPESAGDSKPAQSSDRPTRNKGAKKTAPGTDA